MNYSLVWNTIKYLKPIQLMYQILNRFKIKERIYHEVLPVETRDIRIAIPELDCNNTISARFNIELMKHGKVCLLNQIVELNYNASYTSSLKPLIVNNIFYFEYGIALAEKYRETKDIACWELFKKCYEAYLDAHVDLKSVYSMALHIPNVLIALELFGDVVEKDFREKVYCELYSQYLYIQEHQEKHLLANHYFEDLKALIIASYLFHDDQKLKCYLKDFKKQCEEQVLADGVHYELSLMYHKLILEDVMRIGMLAKQADFPECGWLIPLIQKMTDACYSLEKGIGRTPLFNDAGDNVAKTCEQLCLAAEKQFNIKPTQKASFEDSGYYKLYDGNKALIFDSGRIGVNYQPAHGHCDCLSFELSVGGTPLFVNSGTYEYQGELRKYFRKTCAHNTITINDHEQSQCWGGFRVAKRISHVSASQKGNSVAGQYKNYHGEIHSRKITLRDNAMTVLDKTKASKDSEVKSYLHIAPSYNVIGNEVYDQANKLVCTISTIRSVMECVKTGELCYYASEFGDLLLGTCLVFKWVHDNEYHGYNIEFKM